jgi:molecular chaperone GrpE (heat shock protein)
MIPYIMVEPKQWSEMIQAIEENVRLKAEVDNLRKNADISPSQSPHEIARLKAEVERLDHQVRYWRIEAEVDNARWLRCLEDLEKLRKDSQP